MKDRGTMKPKEWWIMENPQLEKAFSPEKDLKLKTVLWFGRGMWFLGAVLLFISWVYLVWIL